MVIIQQSAKPLPPLDRARVRFQIVRYDELILEPLMVAFEMIQLDDEIPILPKRE